jgi:hypothetical protein
VQEGVHNSVLGIRHTAKYLLVGLKTSMIS